MGIAEGHVAWHSFTVAAPAASNDNRAMRSFDMPLQRRYIAGIAVALICTAVYVNAAIATGRLRYDLTYDDITYVYDATERLGILASQGPFRFLLGFISDPPHSPFSTALAIVALAVGGYHDIVFYAANAVLLVAAVAFLVRSFAQARTGAITWVLAAFLCSPLAIYAVQNFRPDLALGFATAAMAWWFLRGTLDSDESAFWLAGAAAGCALLIKPTFFAHTLALMGALVAFFAIARSYRRRSAPEHIPSWRPVAQFLGLAALVALPYYALAGHAMFDYLWTNTRGKDAHLWSFSPDMSALQVARTFLGPPFQDAIRWHLVLAACLIVPGAAWFLRMGKRRDLALLCALVAVAFGSFLILVVGRHKSEFFFASFQSIIVLAALHCFVGIHSDLQPRARGVFLGVSWVALALIVQLNYAQGLPDSYSETRVNASWNQALAVTIAHRMQARATPAWSENSPAMVFVTVPGPVNAYAVVWSARKLGVPGLGAWDLDRSSDLADFLARAKQSAFIVVPDPVRAQFFRQFPAAAVQRGLGQVLSKDPSFKNISSDVDSAHYLVYENTVRAVAPGPVMDLAPLSSIEGFANEEGPYPQWNLPRVQWATDDRPRVCGPGPGSYEARILLRASAPGTLHVSAAGMTDALLGPVFTDRFVEYRFARNFSPGVDPCIELRPQFSSAPRAGRTLLFSQLRFRRVGD